MQSNCDDQQTKFPSTQMIIFVNILHGHDYAKPNIITAHYSVCCGREHNRALEL